MITRTPPWVLAWTLLLAASARAAPGDSTTAPTAPTEPAKPTEPAEKSQRAYSKRAGPDIELRWARPFALTAPEAWWMSKDQPLFAEGFLVELRVDPAMLVPRQVGAPVLYLGERPVFTFNADYIGGCVVALAAGPVDLETTPFFFGSDTLPERVDAAHGRAERQTAEQAGARPNPPKIIAMALSEGGAPLASTNLQQLHTLAMQRVAACSQTPEDLLRPGVPAAP